MNEQTHWIGMGSGSNRVAAIALVLAVLSLLCSIAVLFLQVQIRSDNHKMRTTINRVDRRMLAAERARLLEEEAEQPQEK